MTNKKNTSNHYSHDTPEVIDIDVENGLASKWPRQQCVEEKQRETCANISPLLFIAGDDCREAVMPAVLQGNEAGSSSAKDNFSCKASANTGSHNTQRHECHPHCRGLHRSKDKIWKDDEDSDSEDVDSYQIPWCTDNMWDDKDDFVVDDLCQGDDFLANPQIKPKASSNDKVLKGPRKGPETNGRPPSRPLNQRSRREYTFIVGAGLGLSFNSGYINGCCLSGLFSPDGFMTQSVAAFTGTYTKAGLELAGGNTLSFVFEVTMILCFVGGSLIAGLINPKAIPYQLGPTYGPTFILGSVLLAVASALASVNPNGKGIFYLAAAANGMQNGMSSMYSGNLIRTTHLTGTSTDIGLFVGQMMRGNWTNAWKLWILLGLAVSFWTGGLVSFYGMRTFQTYSLLLNSGFFFLIGCCLIAFLVSTHHITVWQAVSGTWVLRSVRSIRRRMSSSGISAMAKFGQCSVASSSGSSD